MQPLIDFYKAKRRSLVRLASKRVGPDWAEDAVHDAFEKAVKYYKTYNSDLSDFGTWFNPILKKVCYDVKRANRGGDLEIQEDDWVSIHNPDDIYFLNEILDKIKLYPEHHRQVLYCAFALQCRESDIVNITGLSVHNICIIKERFCTDMRERYGDDSST